MMRTLDHDISRVGHEVLQQMQGGRGSDRAFADWRQVLLDRQGWRRDHIGGRAQGCHSGLQGRGEARWLRVDMLDVEGRAQEEAQLRGTGCRDRVPGRFSGTWRGSTRGSKPLR
eukprot:767523-Hanusia_phi.AAC.6